VQGGPGTGKTVVALHRAAYLLYTFRFPLEGQGVLVVGPNRLFLGYIEQVLPSLGEAGVELAVLADLLDRAGTLSIEGRDLPETARVKGDLRMAKVLAKAVHDRQRPLRRPMRVGYGLQTLSLSVGQSRAIVADAKRRFRLHNAGRRHVEASVYATLADSARVPVDAGAVEQVGQHAELHPGLAEAGQHLLDVAEEEAVGPDHEHALALEREAVGVEEVGGAVEGDDRLARARAALDHEHAGQVGPDDLVLLALDGGDDVGEATGAHLLEGGDQAALPADLAAVVDHVELAAQQAGRLAEQLVLDAEQLAAAGGEVAAAHQAHR
jgi:hypothetical protein